MYYLISSRRITVIGEKNLRTRVEIFNCSQVDRRVGGFWYIDNFGHHFESLLPLGVRNGFNTA